MSVVVLATITPKPGELQTLLDAMAVTVPLVHAEPGCELYAVHTDGTAVFMVERWESPDALRAHSKGENLKSFSASVAPILAGAPVVTVTENVPFGDPAKGTIQ
jgi:quinol monooxygenase YgiN